MPEELAMTRHGAVDCCIEGLLIFYLQTVKPLLLLDVFLRIGSTSSPRAPFREQAGPCIRNLGASWQGFNILVWLCSLLGGFAVAALVLGAVVYQAQSQRPCDSVCSEGLEGACDTQKALVKFRRAGKRLQLRSRWAFIAGWLAGAARLDRCLYFRECAQI